MSSDIVDIGLKVDSSGVKKGRGELDKFGKQSGKTGKATDKLTTSMKLMGAAIIAAAGATLWKVIDQHREFTKAISELSAITGATGKDLQFYNQQAMELGRTTTFSAQEVATAFKLVASAKPDLLDSKEALASVTREVLTLAEASGMTLPESAKALGGSLNQFGADASEASRYINVLAAGAKLGASEVTETAEAMKNAGSVAASLGLSFEETNAAIQGLASVSIKGAEAGTGLRGVLLKLATQSRDDFNPEIVGLSAALKNLQDAELTTAEKSKIFGQESITAATALINQADAVDELTKSLKGTDTAYEQARTNTDNLDGDMKKMGSSWSGVALIIGDIFNPALRGTTKFLTKVGTVASVIAAEVGDLGDMLGAYAAIAVSVAKLDFAAAGSIIDQRKKERELTDEKIKKLWEEGEENKKLGATKAALWEAEANNIFDQMEREEIAEAKRAEAAEKLKEENALKLEEMKIQKELEREAIREAEANLFFDRMEREETLREKREEELEYEREHAAKKLAIERDYYERLYGMQTGSMKAAADFSKAMRDGDLKGMLSTGALALSGMAKNSKKMFKVQKALSMANVLVSLPSAIMKAIENAGGLPFGAFAGAITAAAGAAQLSAIKSTSFGGGGGLPAIPSGGSTSPSAPAGDLPPGATAQPDASEIQQAPPTRELRVTVESDGPHSDGMRKFAEDLAETLKDMGSNTNMVVA